MVPESHESGAGLNLLLPPCKSGMLVPISAPVQAKTWPVAPMPAFKTNTEGMRTP